MNGRLQWERVAVVTDVGWVRHTVNALRFLIASDIRVFTSFQAPEGRAWITAAAQSRSRPAALPPARRRRAR